MKAIVGKVGVVTARLPQPEQGSFQGVSRKTDLGGIRLLKVEAEIPVRCRPGTHRP